MLYEFRHMAEVDKDFENFGADYISTRLEIASCGINSNAPNKGNRGNNDNKRGIFSSLASWFTSKSNQQKQGKKMIKYCTKNSQCHFLRSNYDLKYYSHIIIIRHLSQASGFGKEKNK